MNIIKELKKRFATLETIDGAKDLTIGLSLFVLSYIGFLEMVTRVTPAILDLADKFAMPVGIILIAIGLRKFFVKR